MPRQADEIVAEIRSKRRRARQDLDNLASVRELERRIRSAPEVWLLGGAVTGFICGRFFSRPLLQRGRKAALDLVRSRMRGALMALAVAVGSAVAQQHDSAAAPPTGSREPAPARPGGGREAKRS
jgi:hypothetical protein